MQMQIQTYHATLHDANYTTLHELHYNYNFNYNYYNTATTTTTLHYITLHYTRTLHDTTTTTTTTLRYTTLH